MLSRVLILSFLLPILLTPALVRSETALPDEPCQVVVVGAGIGGLYTAYRLAVETNTVTPSSVCIFEARPKPGGRILSVNDPVPGFRGFTVDLGAYRYRRNQHALMRDLTEKALNLPTTCYTQALRADAAPTAGCDLNTPRRILSARGTVLGASGSGDGLSEVFEKYSTDIPYNIPPEGRWGVPGPAANLTGPRDLGYLLGTLLSPSTTPVALLAEYLPTLLDPLTNYSAAMAVADKIISKLPDEEVFSVRLEQLTLWQYAVRLGIAPDERRLIVETEGVAVAEAMHSPLKDWLRTAVRDYALAKAPFEGPGNAYVIPLDKHPSRGNVTEEGIPPRASLINTVNELLGRVQQAGVRVYFNSRATSVQRVADTDRMRVTLSHGSGTDRTCGTIEAGTVFLNVPKNELTALGTASEPVKGGGAQFSDALSRILPVHLAKTYCFWDEAWWVSKLNFTRGTFRAADEPLFQGRYHDGDVQCGDDRNRTTCRGSLLVSYVGGSSVGAHDAAWLDAVNPRAYSPFTDHVRDNVRVLVPGNMSMHEKLHFEQVHAALRRVHAGAFDALGLNVSVDLPDAAGCVYANWLDMGAHFPVGGAVDADEAQPFKLFARPVPGLNLSLVNEAWGERHGWAESSLLSAERALYHVHGVRRPVWMDAVTHRSLIQTFNTGQDTA